ncbi:MAG: 3'(2'),5'-bisphosphate nucleotidase CysQ [Gemmatimonadota bacterium]|nr:3'(2'),5'-bisphosphate nucleotidase CysQ [Gemmatimonadota bacterium]MDQ8173185.1 3'(2'),5'-bisphosphate nucleotidase CysQ [Gemmatimonadota bacterium]
MVISTEQLVQVVHNAGTAILAVYHAATPIAVEQKADASPLTEADRRSHDVIIAALTALTPAIPIVSEEDAGAEDPVAPLRGDYWLIDPLDGTKEFIKRTGEFTVNIALVHDGRPVMGVVYAPVLGTTWVTTNGGAERWAGDERLPIHVTRTHAAVPLRLVASRDHAGPQVRALLARLPDASTLSMGSSLKFCLIAEGRADLYFRDGPTMPWDTAAAHAVLAAAGGEVFDTAGVPLRYHAPRVLNPYFVAVGDTHLDWLPFLSTGDAP